MVILTSSMGVIIVFNCIGNNYEKFGMKNHNNTIELDIIV